MSVRRRACAPGTRWGPFVVWLVVFYAIWSAVVATAGLWPMVRAHWPIGLAMAGGSFVAGSSPVAGGTVGFPVLVYVFDTPAPFGKTFSLLIQSVGMVSASFFILTCRRRVEWRLLRFAVAGAALAMPLGMALVAPRVSDLAVKTLFSALYASFGLLHLLRLSEIVANAGPSRTRLTADGPLLFGVGLAGGLLASVIGVGADILLYGVLVLLYHSDIRVAIPTAVILMAFTSLVGAICSVVGEAFWPPGRGPLLGVVPYWLAAAPVVVVCGPLGSFVSRHVPREVILSAVAVLCLLQFGWTCYHEHITGRALAVAVLGVLVLNLALHLLFTIGKWALPVESDRSP